MEKRGKGEPLTELAKIPECLGKCEVLKTHDDGDLTIRCGGKMFVVTTEGEVFKKVKARPENWDKIVQELVTGASIEWEGNLGEFIENIADAIIGEGLLDKF
jgi:hypothetical protein